MQRNASAGSEPGRGGKGSRNVMEIHGESVTAGWELSPALSCPQAGGLGAAESFSGSSEGNWDLGCWDLGAGCIPHISVIPGIWGKMNKAMPHIHGGSSCECLWVALMTDAPNYALNLHNPGVSSSWEGSSSPTLKSCCPPEGPSCTGGTQWGWIFVSFPPSTPHFPGASCSSPR